MKKIAILLTILLFGGMHIYAQTANFWNQTVTSDREVSAEKVNAKNVVVRNSSQLTFNTVEGAVINSPFRLEKGSRFRIALGNGSVEDPALMGSEWILFKLQGEEVTGPPINLTFITSEGIIDGMCFCNRYRAPYFYRGIGRITFARTMGTKAYCGEEYTIIENAYREVLESVDHYEVENGRLYFYHGNELVLEYLEY